MEKEKILSTISMNLRDLMNEKGISSSELARLCGLSSGTVSKILQGSMSMSLPMAINLAEGLKVDFNQLLAGLTPKNVVTKSKPQNSASSQFRIGIMSINNKRYSCLIDKEGDCLGSSEIEGGLDLAETSGKLIQLIQESVHAIFPKNLALPENIKNSRINLVTQSFEFEDTRDKFKNFARKYFKDVMLLPDWILTYLSAFKNKKGISLIVDKGVSLSFLNNNAIKKLGGWKFPVYDIGGENWLGVEAIHHAIDVYEGYEQASELSERMLSKFGGKIEKITELCFKGAKDHDVYSLFSEVLLRCYFSNEEASKKIVQNGFEKIFRSINRVDEILGEKVKIALSGSLVDVYFPYFEKNRIIKSSTNQEKVVLLAKLTDKEISDIF